jgi:hypothetical protein
MRYGNEHATYDRATPPQVSWRINSTPAAATPSIYARDTSQTSGTIERLAPLTSLRGNLLESNMSWIDTFCSQVAYSRGVAGIGVRRSALPPADGYVRRMPL